MSKIDTTMVKYSFLYAGLDYDSLDMLKLLREGIKIIWFCNPEDIINNKKELKDYIDAGFAELYSNSNGITGSIIDGENLPQKQELLKKLECCDHNFNLEQYEIEHQDTNKNLIVEAGAGTGKTHVMINRIMFLMHIDKDFSFSKVAMITFTNKATDNMRHRLIKTLNLKYKLTGKTKYLDRVEELSQINISTIHSFFKKVIVEAGSILGYGTNIQLRSYILEKKELLRKLLNNQYTGNKRVEDTIGLSIHDIEKIALMYWEKLDNNGLSEDEIIALNWGDTSDEKAQKIQKTLVELFRNVDSEYNQIKYMDNAISMRDIIHELSRVIHNPEFKDYISNNYKYMFCDEFQDSDNVQIQTIAVLNRVYEGNLFVVGDIKQSIYRFRGATDSAFIKLEFFMNEKEREKLEIKSLTKNYRTSSNVLDELDLIFQTWGKEGKNLLQYENSDRLVPQISEKGEYRQIVLKQGEREKKVIDTIKEIQSNNEHKEITILTRKNSELQTIRKWCEKEKIVCLIKEKGSFYKSEAVLDFCAMAEAFLFDNEPMYLFNYIMSSYGEGKINYDLLVKAEGKKEKILEVLLDKLDRNYWDKNREDLRNKPVMAILRRIVSDANPVNKFCVRRREELILKNYPEKEAINQSIIDSTQYEADLKKLLQILTSQFSGDFCSLLDICDFLRIKIMTDRDEEAAEIVNFKQIEYVEGLTVHGSKGLEFENVLIPFMNGQFYQSCKSEIILSRNHKEVGWAYRENNQDEIKNELYDILLDEEKDEVAKEETRLLYVAMTRAIYGLFCFVERKNVDKKMVSTWAELLPKEKDNA